MARPPLVSRLVISRTEMEAGEVEGEEGGGEGTQRRANARVTDGKGVELRIGPSPET